jgi:soluble lytic murein transglycosylase-like protein
MTHPRSGPVPGDEDEPGLGLRQGGERRHAQRREGRPSPEGDRRFEDRRRKTAGGLVLAMMALGGGIQQVRQSASNRSAPEAIVAVTEDYRVPAKDRLYDHIIQEAAATYHVDPDLIRAVIRAESGFDPAARSAAGAEGLMQLMPFLSRELGVKDPFDPRDNIFGGTKYLGLMLQRCAGDVSLALASYNAGPRAVRRHKGIPPYKETRGYVRKIKGMMAEAQTAEQAPMQIALAD